MMLAPVSLSLFPVDPALSVSRVPVRVRFAETDAMGVVHHASYPLYFEVARVEWLRRRGVRYTEMRANGVHLPVVELSLKYTSPAWFDDPLDVIVELVEVRSASVRFEYRIERDSLQLTEGFTRLACVGADGRPLRVSDEMRAVLQRGELGNVGT